MVKYEVSAVRRPDMAVYIARPPPIRPKAPPAFLRWVEMLTWRAAVNWEAARRKKVSVMMAKMETRAIEARSRANVRRKVTILEGES